jgi:site-specific DNA-methyltransferase (adenine-specific)
MMMCEDADRKDLPVTKGTSEWEGWGTALKPAHEPIVMARKPFKGNVAQNVLEWGTGGINIDESRVGYNDDKPHSMSTIRNVETMTGWATNGGLKDRTEDWEPNNTGRWPANIIFDEEAGEILDQQSGISKSVKGGKGKAILTKDRVAKETITERSGFNDKGGASRFFYCPKASKKDREDINNHPTVKPTDLMLYLIKLVTPVGGTILEPFMGSGSTGKAAVRGGYDFIGIEREEEYYNISKARIENESRIS